MFDGLVVNDVIPVEVLRWFQYIDNNLEALQNNILFYFFLLQL
jgi:hypothetical protein